MVADAQGPKMASGQSPQIGNERRVTRTSANGLHFLMFGLFG